MFVAMQLCMLDLEILDSVPPPVSLHACAVIH